MDAERILQPLGFGFGLQWVKSDKKINLTFTITAPFLAISRLMNVIISVKYCIIIKNSKRNILTFAIMSLNSSVICSFNAKSDLKLSDSKSHSNDTCFFWFKFQQTGLLWIKENYVTKFKSPFWRFLTFAQRWWWLLFASERRFFLIDSRSLLLL